MALQQRASVKFCGVVQGVEFQNLHRWRHLYSAERPSRWASAHISSPRMFLTCAASHDWTKLFIFSNAISLWLPVMFPLAYSIDFHHFSTTFDSVDVLLTFRVFKLPQSALSADHTDWLKVKIKQDISSLHETATGQPWWTCTRLK